MVSLILLILVHSTIFCIGSLVDCPDANITVECGYCRSQNDPHIVTFDDVYYDQHQQQCFQYITGCIHVTDYIPFEICGCHISCYGSTSIACIGDINIKFKDETGAETFNIDVIHSPLQFAFNTLSGSSLITGEEYIFDATNTHKFSYDLTSATHSFNIYSGTGTNVFYAYISYRRGNFQVFVSANYFQNKVCGLCGLFDGNQANELLGSDNVQYMTASLVASLPSLTFGDANIDTFADTYSCGTPAPISGQTPSPFFDDYSYYYDPTTPDMEVFGTLTDVTATCRTNAGACCDMLWISTIAVSPGGAYSNRILSEADVKPFWKEGCIVDVCELTGNAFGGDCEDPATEFTFSFAADIATQTVSETFPVLAVSPLGDGGDLESDSQGVDSSDSSGSEEDIIFSGHKKDKLYEKHILNDKKDDGAVTYTVNLSFGYGLWIIIAIFLVFIPVLCLICVNKRNVSLSHKIEGDELPIVKSV